MLDLPLVIAIVDSDPSMRQLLGVMARSSGDIAVEAATAAEGRVLLCEYPWDIALIGRSLPDGDGLDLCREVATRVRQAEVHRHLLFLSPSKSPVDILPGFDAGADECVELPIDEGEFRPRLQAIRRNVLMQKALHGRLAMLEQLSLIDDLTHVYNRRFLEAETGRLFDVSLRHGRPLSIAMIDLDEFKIVNDTYGHSVGDIVLREVSTAIAESLRSSDVLARYGGEEFVVLMTETTLPEAVVVGERIRSAVAELRIPCAFGELSVTLSIGLAGLPAAHLESAAKFIKAADEALYQAKRDGRNCVRLAGGANGVMSESHLGDSVADSVTARGADQRNHLANPGASSLLHPHSSPVARPLREVLPYNSPPMTSSEFGVERKGSAFPPDGSDALMSRPASVSGDTDSDAGPALKTERSRSEELLTRNISLLHATIDSTGEGILVLNRAGSIALYNRRAAAMWNITPEMQRAGDDHGMLRHAIQQLRDPESFVAAAQQFDWQNADETRDVLELKDGRVFERYSIPYSVAGGIAGRVWSFRDVTDARAAAQAVDDLEKKFRILFDQNLAGFYTCDGDGIITECNPSFARMLGFSASTDVIGLKVDEFHRDRGERQEVRSLLRDVPTLPSIEVVFVRRNGSFLHALESITRVEDQPGAAFTQSTIVDIDDLKRAEEQVRFQAYHDSLTLLPNRQLFRDRLTMTIAQATRGRRQAAVLFIDIDDFKKVNDIFGHATGDELLVILAERLQTRMRSTDTLSRTGGDEFEVAIGELSSVLDAERVARKLMQTISLPLQIADRTVFLTPSIGIALFPADGSDGESLMRSADNALFAAKQAGGNIHKLSTPEMNSRAIERFIIETSLRQAIDRQELLLHYQPIVNAETGVIMALEALIRWPHPERGLLSPESFIPIAEDTGLIIQLGEWVLRQACADAVEWQQKGLRAVRVAVNVSPRQFQRSDIAGIVQRALEETALSSELLELEVTESVAAADPEQTTRILRLLRTQGVRIAIDDIGTGYSSLSYLKQFPVCTVKIDRSFVNTVLTDRADAAIVKAVIGVAHSLEMEVVAEGVETAEQMTFLRDGGCDLLQGFLFGHPLPAQHWHEPRGDSAAEFLPTAADRNQAARAPTEE